MLIFVGTAAVMALLYDRGELKLGEKFTHHSILDTVFSGQLLDTVQVRKPFRSFFNEDGIFAKKIRSEWRTDIYLHIVLQGLAKILNWN